MSCVLFTSNRELNRAENLKAVYDAYDGEKRFARFCDVHDLHSGRYSLQVSDELPTDEVCICHIRTAILTITATKRKS